MSRRVLLLALLATPHLTFAAEKPPTKSADVFGLDKVWALHLTIPAKEWETMQPARGGFNRPKADMPALSEERKLRGGFRYDFEYVKGDLEINGVRLPDVGIRFKGNSSYMLTSSHLKRPFKLDLDRNDDEQTWGGMRKLTLNNNVMDSSATREALAYGVYRAAGVPAPRTAFAQVSLTVPGKYDKEVVGLYTLIETVDKPFLKDHFGSAKGLLLKPEYAGPLEYLGEDWAAYESRYRPKTTPDAKAKKRLIDLAGLIHLADDARFYREIAGLMDVDRCLRYIAATVVLSSLDSFVGLGHNYYLYLDPKSNKFVLLPWDLDHSFGALTMVGGINDLVDLSIRRPWTGRNRLIERLLADEKHFAAYKGHVAALVATAFTAEAIARDAAAITKAVTPVKEAERQAVAKRGEGWNTFLLLGSLNRPYDVETFTKKRVASLVSQLEGKSQGTVLRGQGGAPGAARGAERMLAKPALEAADRDKDGKVSREEMTAAVRRLFAACDVGNKGVLDQRALVAGLEKVLPKQPANPRGGMGGDLAPTSQAAPVAKAIFAQAAKDGRLTADQLVAAAEKAFEQADRKKAGKLDQREVGEALRVVFAPPAVAVDKTKKEK